MVGSNLLRLDHDVYAYYICGSSVHLLHTTVCNKRADLLVLTRGHCPQVISILAGDFGPSGVRAPAKQSGHYTRHYFSSS